MDDVADVLARFYGETTQGADEVEDGAGAVFVVAHYPEFFALEGVS